MCRCTSDVNWELERLGSKSDSKLTIDINKKLKARGLPLVARSTTTYNRIKYHVPRARPKKINYLLEPLGKYSVSKLAEMIGVSRCAIYRAHQRYHVPLARPDRYNYINWEIQGFGKKTDTQISKEVNRSPNIVLRWRRKYHVPAGPKSNKANWKHTLVKSKENIPSDTFLLWNWSTLDIEQIAEKTNRSAKAVYEKAKCLGLLGRKDKLTKEQFYKDFGWTRSQLKEACKALDIRLRKTKFSQPKIKRKNNNNQRDGQYDITLEQADKIHEWCMQNIQPRC